MIAASAAGEMLGPISGARRFFFIAALVQNLNLPRATP